MSGRKCANVTISERSYYELLRSIQRADDETRAAQARVEAERRRHRTIQQAFELQQRELHDEYLSAIDDLSEEMQHLERSQMERLDDVRRESAQRLVTLDQDLTHRIEEQGARYDQALNEHRAAVANALHAIRQDIQAGRQRQRAAASTQIRDLQSLFRLMREQRTHERFAPGELDRIEAAFAMCRNNLQSGHYEAALAGAQERYVEYQELQLRVAKRQAEWQAYLDEVRRLTEQTCGAMAAAEGATYRFGEDRAAHEVAAEVDYWSEGELGEFRDRLSGYLRRVQSPADLSTDDLKQLLREVAPMNAELDGIVADAKDRLVQSQVRRNLAASILTSFEGTPWKLADSTYEEQDFRKGLHMKLENTAGEEIVASIIPVETPEGGITANVEINFFDRFNSKRLRAARLEQMERRMRAEGVDAGSFECLDNSEGRPGNQERRDFELLRAVGASSANSREGYR